MFRPFRTTLVLVLVTAAGTGPAAGQIRSVSDGLRINVHGSAVHMSGEAGVRPGYSASYGNSRWFAVFMTVDRHGGMHDGAFAYRLQHVDVGVRTHLRGSDAGLVPFALVAYTWRGAKYGRIAFLGETMDVRRHGTGPSLGGGALYYLAPRLAVEAAGKVSLGALSHVTANGVTFRAEDRPVSGASFRLNAGLSWFPDIPGPR
jgi:hypothetical protein